MSGRPEKEYLVVGLGRFGASLATKLVELGCEVMATDISPKLVQELSTQLGQVVAGDATSAETLRALGAEAFDTAIVCIGQDFEANVLVTSALKHDFGVKQVICKALSHRQKDVLLRVGADQVVLPEHDSGVKLAHQLRKYMVPVQRLELRENLSLSVLSCPPAMVGKTVADLEVLSKHGVSLLNVTTEERLQHMGPGDRLEAQSLLLVLGPDHGISSFMEDSEGSLA